MNIESLRIFCEVARQRSFSRAAGHLRITQSAASQAVQALERELGHTLIDRTHRPPALTDAGARFCEDCHKILDDVQLAISRLSESDGEVAGPLYVASIYSIGLYSTEAIRSFMASYPKVNVRLQYLRPNQVLQAVHDGEASLGLISYPRETREIAVVAWKNEDMVLVCPPRHPLVSDKRPPLESLAGQSFIAFDRDLAIRRHIDEVLRDHKVEVRVVMEFDNVETLKQAVQIGAGVSILPEATVQQEAAAGTLAIVRLPSAELVRPVGIVFRKNRPLTLTVIRFVETLIGRSISLPGENGDRQPEPSKPGRRRKPIAETARTPEA
jgi:DNA-binding transcriptional LysR family regulator